MKHHYDDDDVDNRKPYPSGNYTLDLVCASVTLFAGVAFAVFLGFKLFLHAPELPPPSQHTNTVEEETGIRVLDGDTLK